MSETSARAIRCALAFGSADPNTGERGDAAGGGGAVPWPALAAALGRLPGTMGTCGYGGGTLCTGGGGGASGVFTAALEMGAAGAAA